MRTSGSSPAASCPGSHDASAGSICPRSRRRPDVADYRVDELATVAGTTVRNIRSYQDRGLLPPPRREGRVGYYSEAHLARLRIIGGLLERGFTLQNIAELLDAWERGHHLGDLLGLEVAVASPFSDEIPTYATFEQLVELFGPPQAVDEDLFSEIVLFGLVNTASN